MLNALKAVHRELRDALAELEVETRKSEPDETSLPMARLKLTRVSGRRRCLVDNVIGPRLHDASPEVARQLENLRRAASDLAIESAEHIARWTMRYIVADWNGYRASSAAMRTNMLRRINEEGAILYPLLESRGSPNANAA